MSKLWAYLGMHVDDGMAPHRHRGQRANWSAQGRVVCHQIGVAIVRVRRGRYRAAYDRKKAEYLARFERDWLPVTRNAGRELVGAYTILESNLQVLVILAMPDLETHARGMGARLSDTDRARWSAGASEIRTDWVLKLLVPAGVGGITG